VKVIRGSFSFTGRYSLSLSIKGLFTLDLQWINCRCYTLHCNLNFRHLHFLHSDRGLVGTIRKWCSLRCPQSHLSNWLKDTLFKSCGVIKKFLKTIYWDKIR